MKTKIFKINLCAGLFAAMPFMTVPKGLDFPGIVTNLVHHNIVFALVYFFILVLWGAKYTKLIDKNFSELDDKSIFGIEILAFLSAVAINAIIFMIKIGVHQGLMLTGIFAVYYFVFLTVLDFVLAYIKQYKKNRERAKN